MTLLYSTFCKSCNNQAFVSVQLPCLSKAEVKLGMTGCLCQPQSLPVICPDATLGRPLC